MPYRQPKKHRHYRACSFFPFAHLFLSNPPSLQPADDETSSLSPNIQDYLFRLCDVANSCSSDEFNSIYVYSTVYILDHVCILHRMYTPLCAYSTVCILRIHPTMCTLYQIISPPYMYMFSPYSPLYIYSSV